MFNLKSGGQGKLDVKVAEARSLVSSTSNVYCVLRLGKEKRHTRTSRNSDSPQWDESFEFPVSAACDETLEVLVWDKGRLWRDNFLGMVTISMKSVKGKTDEDQWYKLARRPNKPKEVVRGDIRLVMSLDIPEEEEEKEEEEEEKEEDKAKEPAGEEDEMALVNAYLRASQTVSTDNKKKPAKPEPKKKDKSKPNPAVKRSENTITAIVKELQELHQNNPASCVKKIRWDGTSRTVTVQLTNVDHGAVNLSIFLGEDASPVTMLEGVSGSVDEKKVERLVDQVNDYSSDQSAALVDIINFLTSRFDRSLNKSQFVSAIRASQLAPKGGAVDPAPRKDKGKEKAADGDDGDGEAETGSGRPLGISQALGRDWRTASALVPTDDEDEEEDGEYNDSEYDDEDGYIDDDDWDMPAEETLMEKHVKQLHVIFGNQCASVWRDLGVVRLFVDAHFFEEMAAEAMGIDREQPITIILTFGEGYLENDALPKAEVKQPQNPRFALEFQLTHIAQTFIRDNWPKRKMGISLPGATEKKERAKMKLRTNDVGNLVKQGFDQLAAANALEITGNNFAKAIKLLKSQGGQVDIAALSSSEEAKHNFLGWMMTYMLGRMRNCSSNCLICDVKLEGSGIKPVVCSDEKCVWRYEELGLGVKVTTELSFDEDVVDLFMSMLYSACSSDRKNLICDPFPPDFIKDAQKRHDEVQNCLNCLTGIHELAEFKNDERRLRAYLESKDALLYRLIRWVLSSNRAFIKKMDPDTHLSAMQTPHQYLLLSSPPERKAKFDAYRLQYGSFFAFHGSALENWHAIMRKGLRNLSNTEFMTTGAAYGAGIYLSPHASTSKGYARMGRGWDHSRFGNTNMTCMAICEIIDHPSLAGMPNPHYVVADEDLVCTRLFCFYTDKETIPDSVDLASLASALFKLQGFTPAKDYPTKTYSDGY